MSVTIEQPSPLSAASDAAGSFLQSHEEKERYNQEQAHQAAQEAERHSEFEQQQGLAQRTETAREQESDRAATLQERVAAMNQANEQARIAMQRATDQWQKDHDTERLRQTQQQITVQQQQFKDTLKQTMTIAQLHDATERYTAQLSSSTQIAAAQIYANASGQHSAANQFANLSPEATSWLSDASNQRLTIPQMLDKLNKDKAAGKFTPADLTAMRTVIASGHAGTVSGAAETSTYGTSFQFGKGLEQNQVFQALPENQRTFLQSRLAKQTPAQIEYMLEQVASGAMASPIGADGKPVMPPEDAAQMLTVFAAMKPQGQPHPAAAPGPQAPQAKSAFQLLMDRIRANLPAGSGAAAAFGTPPPQQ